MCDCIAVLILYAYYERETMTFILITRPLSQLSRTSTNLEEIHDLHYMTNCIHQLSYISTLKLTIGSGSKSRKGS